MENLEKIQIIRERTGCGHLYAKKALLENGLDIEKAIQWIRSQYTGPIKA